MNKEQNETILVTMFGPIKRLKTYQYIVLFATLGLCMFMLGPKPEPFEFNPELPVVHDLTEVEDYLVNQEKQYRLKPNNEARIVWFDDSLRNQTEYCLVYLHGFSASHMEGEPIHRNLAKKFGMNLLLARLAEHGLEEQEPMLNLTANNLMYSAQEALAIGEKLGKKVILMSHSTGGTLSLFLASRYPELIRGLVLYSPNIAISDPNARFVNDPYGVDLAKLVKGSDYNEWQADDERKKYWTTKYRLEAVAELEELIEATMTTETFNRVNQPTFLGYYYKDETHQDDVVSVSAMLEMYKTLGTPEESKTKIAYPNAGNHVIACSVVSDHYKQVEEDTQAFLQFQMGLTKAR